MSDFIFNPKHDFSTKLRQPSVLPSTLVYVDWKRREREALAKGETPPDPPEGLGPLSINLDLTTACSYLCNHCIDLNMLNSGINYHHEHLMSSLQSLIDHGLRSVILIGGGESTIYPKFPEVVRFLKEKGMQVALVSNGGHNETIHKVADAFTKGDWVRLSLDSGNNDTFVRMHNPRKKDLTLEGICSWVPRIREKNPELPVGFSFIVVWNTAKTLAGTNIIENVGEIVTATRLARDNRFSYISFKPFLERYPDGAEVLDPSSVADLDEMVARIRAAVNEAKTYETDDFKVVESTNLKLLEEKQWHRFTRQPRTCHMQAFHGVLSPLGLFHCPGWRPLSKAILGKGLVAGKDAYATPENVRATQLAVANVMRTFDASKECAQITCLYNSANWMLERAVNGEIELEALEERSDYFL